MLLPITLSLRRYELLAWFVKVDHQLMAFSPSSWIFQEGQSNSLSHKEFVSRRAYSFDWNLTLPHEIQFTFLQGNFLNPAEVFNFNHFASSKNYWACIKSHPFHCCDCSTIYNLLLSSFICMINDSIWYESTGATSTNNYQITSPSLEPTPWVCGMKVQSQFEALDIISFHSLILLLIFHEILRYRP